MTDSTWYQQAMVSPEVLEVNIRIGVIPTQDHAQVLVEMKDPTTGVLLGQWSRHHVTMHGLTAALVDAMAQANGWLEASVEPF